MCEDSIKRKKKEKKKEKKKKEEEEDKCVCLMLMLEVANKCFIGMGMHFPWSLSRHLTLVLQNTATFWTYVLLAWVCIPACLSHVI